MINQCFGIEIIVLIYKSYMVSRIPITEIKTG